MRASHWMRTTAVATLAVLGLSAAALAEKPLQDMTPEERRVVFQRELGKAYLDTFEPALRRFDRLPRLVATVAVARLDSEEATTALVDSLRFASGLDDFREARRGGPDPVVAWLAWEALRGRLDSLSDDQLATWRKAGIVSAANGGFPGELSATLFEAAASGPASDYGDAVGGAAATVVARTPWNDEKPAAELVALRDAVAAWRDREVVEALLDRQLLRLNTAPQKVDYVLSALPGAPAAIEGAPAARDVMRRWRPWLRSDVTPASADDLSTYVASDLLLPKPETPDLEDESWRDAFEAGDLEVRGVDLAWVIDATGSMAEENKAVARATGRVMSLLSVLSGESRGAAVYVRHEVIDELQQNCCRHAEGHPRGYTARPFPLTSDIARLSRAMFFEPVPKPNREQWANMHPGTAVHGGMVAAQQGLRWNTEGGALHAIVLVADAEMTPKTEDATAKLAYDFARRGVRILALHTQKPDEHWKRAIEEAAGGSVIRFKAGDINRSGLPTEPLKAWTIEAAEEQFGNINPFEDVALRIIDSAVTEGYHPRIRQVIVATGPFMRAAFPDMLPNEKR